MLNPRVASASFADETAWIPRGVPSFAEFAEVAGGSRLTRSPTSRSSSSVPMLPRAAWRCTARRSCHLQRAPGFAWARPSPCRRRVRSIALDTLVQTTAAPSVTPAPTHLPTSPPTASPSANRFSTICASTDDPSALLKPHLGLRKLRESSRSGCRQSRRPGAFTWKSRAQCRRRSTATTSPSC